ncbi:MAG: HEPN domain-containing protein [Candidatus Heimdallarchaeaceae archaeon]
MKIPSWTLKEIEEIDKMYFKALEIEEEAERKKMNYEYDLCVRRSQESFELYIKTVFHFMDVQYPKNHDISSSLRKINDALDEVLEKYYFPKEQIVRIIIGSKIFKMVREIALYGFEGLREAYVTKIFREKEAVIALDYVVQAKELCNVVRNYFYSHANNNAPK